MIELEIMVTGVAIVMGVLTLLWGLTAAVGFVAVRVDGGFARRRSRAEAAGTKVGAGIPPHHLVAIAAAVAETLGAPHRIVRISAPVGRQSDWTVRGRGQHRVPLPLSGRPGHKSAGQGPQSSRMKDQ